MLNMVEKFGINYEEVRRTHLKPDFMRFHFTSKRKRMSTIIENCGDTEYSYDKRVHMKGASEIVLKCCTHYID
jgi:Ca2+-transporting ATPase